MMLYPKMGAMWRQGSPRVGDEDGRWSPYKGHGDERCRTGGVSFIFDMSNVNLLWETVG